MMQIKKDLGGFRIAETAEGYGDRGSKGQSTKASKKIAGKDLALVVPPARGRDRIRTDVPAIVVPNHVDRTEHTIRTLDLEDIGVPIDEQ
jgi:hypothetical protein